MFLSNTVTRQQILSLPTCFVFFIFFVSRNLNGCEAKPRRVRSCRRMCTTQTAGGSAAPNETARTEHMLSCFVGGLSVASPPSLSSPPTPPHSLPLSIPPHLGSSSPLPAPDCMSLPRSLTVRERMLPNAQPLSVRASEPTRVGAGYSSVVE